MRISITDRHENVTDEIKEHAQDRAERLVKFLEGIKHIDVLLDTEGDQYAVEIVVGVPRSQTLVGHATEGDFLAAIDQAASKLERQLKKMNDKLHRRDRGDKWEVMAGETESEQE